MRPQHHSQEAAGSVSDRDLDVSPLRGARVDSPILVAHPPERERHIIKAKRAPDPSSVLFHGETFPRSVRRASSTLDEATGSRAGFPPYQRSPERANTDVFSGGYTKAAQNARSTDALRVNSAKERSTTHEMHTSASTGHPRHRLARKQGSTIRAEVLDELRASMTSGSSLPKRNKSESHIEDRTNINVPNDRNAPISQSDATNPVRKKKKLHAEVNEPAVIPQHLKPKPYNEDEVREYMKKKRREWRMGEPQVVEPEVHRHERTSKSYDVDKVKAFMQQKLVEREEQRKREKMEAEDKERKVAAMLEDLNKYRRKQGEILKRRGQIAQTSNAWASRQTTRETRESLSEIAEHYQSPERNFPIATETTEYIGSRAPRDSRSSIEDRVSNSNRSSETRSRSPVTNQIEPEIGSETRVIQAATKAPRNSNENRVNHSNRTSETRLRPEITDVIEPESGGEARVVEPAVQAVLQPSHRTNIQEPINPYHRLEKLVASAKSLQERLQRRLPVEDESSSESQSLSSEISWNANIDTSTTNRHSGARDGAADVSRRHDRLSRRLGALSDDGHLSRSLMGDAVRNTPKQRKKDRGDRLAASTARRTSDASQREHVLGEQEPGALIESQLMHAYMEANPINGYDHQDAGPQKAPQSPPPSPPFRSSIRREAATQGTVPLPSIDFEDGPVIGDVYNVINVYERNFPEALRVNPPGRSDVGDERVSWRSVKTFLRDNPHGRTSSLQNVEPSHLPDSAQVEDTGHAPEPALPDIIKRESVVSSPQEEVITYEDDFMSSPDTPFQSSGVLGQPLGLPQFISEVEAPSQGVHSSDWNGESEILENIENGQDGKGFYDSIAEDLAISGEHDNAVSVDEVSQMGSLATRSEGNDGEVEIRGQELLDTMPAHVPATSSPTVETAGADLLTNTDAAPTNSSSSPTTSSYTTNLSSTSESTSAHYSSQHDRRQTPRPRQLREIRHTLLNPSERLSPQSLSKKLMVEINLLEAIEESRVQLAELENTGQTAFDRHKSQAFARELAETQRRNEEELQNAQQERGQREADLGLTTPVSATNLYEQEAFDEISDLPTRDVVSSPRPRSGERVSEKSSGNNVISENIESVDVDANDFSVLSDYPELDGSHSNGREKRNNHVVATDRHIPFGLRGSAQRISTMSARQLQAHLVKARSKRRDEEAHLLLRQRALEDQTQCEVALLRHQRAAEAAASGGNTELAQLSKALERAVMRRYATDKADIQRLKTAARDEYEQTVSAVKKVIASRHPGSSHPSGHNREDRREPNSRGISTPSEVKEDVEVESIIEVFDVESPPSEVTESIDMSHSAVGRYRARSDPVVASSRQVSEPDSGLSESETPQSSFAELLDKLRQARSKTEDTSRLQRKERRLGMSRQIAEDLVRKTRETAQWEQRLKSEEEQIKKLLDGVMVKKPLARDRVPHEQRLARTSASPSPQRPPKSSRPGSAADNRVSDPIEEDIIPEAMSESIAESIPEVHSDVKNSKGDDSVEEDIIASAVETADDISSFHADHEKDVPSVIDDVSSFKGPQSGSGSRQYGSGSWGPKEQPSERQVNEDDQYGDTFEEASELEQPVEIIDESGLSEAKGKKPRNVVDEETKELERRVALLQREVMERRQRATEAHRVKMARHRQKLLELEAKLKCELKALDSIIDKTIEETGDLDEHSAVDLPAPDSVPPAKTSSDGASKRVPDSRAAMSNRDRNLVPRLAPSFVDDDISSLHAPIPEHPIEQHVASAHPTHLPKTQKAELAEEVIENDISDNIEMDVEAENADDAEEPLPILKDHEIQLPGREKHTEEQQESEADRYADDSFAALSEANLKETPVVVDEKDESSIIESVYEALSEFDGDDVAGDPTLTQNTQQALSDAQHVEMEEQNAVGEDAYADDSFTAPSEANLQEKPVEANESIISKDPTLAQNTHALFPDAQNAQTEVQKAVDEDPYADESFAAPSEAHLQETPLVVDDKDESSIIESVYEALSEADEGDISGDPTPLAHNIHEPLPGAHDAETEEQKEDAYAEDSFAAISEASLRESSVVSDEGDKGSINDRVQKALSEDDEDDVEGHPTLAENTLEAVPDGRHIQIGEQKALDEEPYVDDSIAAIPTPMTNNSPHAVSPGPSEDRQSEVASARLDVEVASQEEIADWFLSQLIGDAVDAMTAVKYPTETPKKDAVVLMDVPSVFPSNEHLGRELDSAPNAKLEALAAHGGHVSHPIKAGSEEKLSMTDRITNSIMDTLLEDTFVHILRLSGHQPSDRSTTLPHGHLAPVQAQSEAAGPPRRLASQMASEFVVSMLRDHLPPSVSGTEVYDRAPSLHPTSLQKILSDPSSDVHPIRRTLLFHATNEALAMAFSDHEKRLARPHAAWHTLPPRPLSRQQVIDTCTANVVGWAGYSERNGENLDALLISQIKDAEQTWKRRREWEEQAWDDVAEELWEDMLGDTVNTLQSLEAVASQ
ncbi:hypothetical protein DFJ77DRAFT_505868 [Powellomyces hirtus]|nr:hypothetical protein DFJ77DRAFT_505868 [Powellomyces hirtus]